MLQLSCKHHCKSRLWRPETLLYYRATNSTFCVL